MIPSCIQSPNAQSFAIPCRVDKEGFEGLTKDNGFMKIGRYLQPLATLTKAAQHLWAIAYGGKGAIGVRPSSRTRLIAQLSGG